MRREGREHYLGEDSHGEGSDGGETGCEVGSKVVGKQTLNLPGRLTFLRYGDESFSAACRRARALAASGSSQSEVQV